MVAIKKIRRISREIIDDPSRFGRACGYGVLGATLVLLGLLTTIALLLVIVLSPLLIVGIPVGFVASRLIAQQRLGTRLA